jgi:hypothetical protein
METVSGGTGLLIASKGGVLTPRGSLDASEKGGPKWSKYVKNSQNDQNDTKMRSKGYK